MIQSKDPLAQSKEPKATSKKRVAQLKRRTSGAERTIATCDRKIKLLRKELEKSNLSFSERQFIQGKITQLQVVRYEAQMSFRNNDKVFRGAVQQNNKIRNDQFRGQRYEDRILPVYDQFFFDWRVSLQTAATNTPKIKELPVELVGLAGGDDRQKFNAQALALLELVDPKPVEKLRFTKRLKPRLLKSLDKFFGDGPSYLPEPRVALVEKSLATDGVEGDADTE